MSARCNSWLTLEDLAHMLVLDAPQVNPVPVCHGSCKLMPVSLHVLFTRKTHTSRHLSADCVFVLRVPMPSFRWIGNVRGYLLYLCDVVVLIEVVLRREILAPYVEAIAPLFAVLYLCLSLNSLT